MNTEIGKIIGRVEKGWWMQIHDFIPEDPAKLVSRGRLILAVSFQHQDTEVDNASEGKEMLMRFHELYYSQCEGSCVAQLKIAAQTVTSEFSGVELVGVALIDERIDLVSVGGGVWAKVGEKEGWLITVGGNEVVGLSGRLVMGQRLVLGNSQFWQCFPVGMIRTNSDVEILTSAAHGGDKGDGVVGIILKVSNIQYSMSNIQSESKRFDFHLPKFPQLPQFPKLPIFITNQDQTQARQRTIKIGIGFLLILIFILGLGGWRSRQLSIKNSQLNRQLESLTSKFTEAQTLAILNPNRSRELVSEIQNSLSEVQKLKGADKDKRFVEIKLGLETLSDQVLGIKRVASAEVVDLGLIRENMTATQLRFQDNKLLALDSVGGRVVEVDPAKKSGKVIVGNLKDAQLLATYPKEIMVLTAEGIVETPDKLKVKKNWDKVLDMGMFSGNIYLLASDGIYRYQTSENGFGAKQKWHTDTGSSMAIDGSIWVINKTINKYTRGNKEEFTVSGLDKELGDSAKIYTDENSQKLYVLDPNNNRIVVIKKTGEYESQYVAEGIKSAMAITVDEKASQVYLLSGSKIEAIKL